MSVTDEIRDRTDIADIVGQKVSLKRSGKSFKGNCPFHAEKTPSFYVYPENWSYHCFGCGAHGNGFDFVMATERMDFGDALRHLAQRAGVTLVERQVDTERDKVRARLREVHEHAVQYFHNLLLQSPAGQQARAYVEKRGLKRETIEAFQLGYSLNSWDAMGSYLASKGYKPEELISAGLAVQREDGSTYDRFRNRLMFPIKDATGGMSGFGARALDDSHPKYMNSPETPIFDKGATLFAIDKAASAIRSRDLAIIVEGYMDAIMAHQCGCSNVIASMGTALSEKQIRTLKRLSKNLALALDPDAAGDEATLRGLQVAKEAFDQKVIAIPTWQGYVRYEHRLDANIRIVTLPRGKDPDEIIREDPSAWLELIGSAQPTVDFLFTAISAKVDLKDPKGKSRAVEELLAVISEIPDNVIRAHYIRRLADLVNVDERLLLSSLSKNQEGRRSKVTPPPISSAKALSTGRDRAEAHGLAFLIQHPELRAEAGALDSTHFSHTDYHAILEAWRTATSLEELADILGETFREELTYLAGFPLPPTDSAAKVEELASIVRTLEERRLKRMSKDNAARLREAEAASDGDQVLELQRSGVEIASRISEVERAHRAS